MLRARRFKGALLALGVAIMGLAGCLTEDDWTANAPVMGGRCGVAESRACAENNVLRCSGLAASESWVLEETCRTGESCVDGACVCPTDDCRCTPGATKCEGLTVQTCSERQSWTSKPCSDACRPLGYSKVTGCDAATGKATCLCAHEGKIGDPCTASSECKVGACNGHWCQKSCTTYTDCGTTSVGGLNWCLKTSTGALACFPSCSGAECPVKFPGTTCLSTKTPSGTSVKVCSVGSTP